MNELHVVIADITALPGSAERLRRIEERLVNESLTETGCIHYELNQALGDDHRFFIIETWASESDWRAHSTGCAFQRFKASGGSDLIEHLEIYHLRRVQPEAREP